MQQQQQQQQQLHQDQEMQTLCRPFAAALGDRLVAGREIEMVGVGEHHLCADGRALARARARRP